MYAIIGKYPHETKLVFKTFNKDIAMMFFDNASNGRAGIWYRDLQNIEL